MMINREGPTQSSIAIFFACWVLLNSGVLTNMNLALHVLRGWQQFTASLKLSIISL